MYYLDFEKRECLINMLMNDPDAVTVNFSTLNAGQSGVIACFAKKYPGYRKKLMSMGLTSGTPFKVIRIAPLGDPIEVLVRGTMISLRRKEASVISVILDS